MIAFWIGFIWIVVRAQVWRTLLRNRPSYSDTFWTVGEGYLLNNFLPFRLGEIGRAFLLSRKSGMQFMEIFPTIVIERAMDLGYSAVIFVGGHSVRCRRGRGRSGSELSLACGAGLVCLVILYLWLVTINGHWIFSIN